MKKDFDKKWECPDLPRAKKKVDYIITTFLYILYALPFFPPPKNSTIEI